jgi:hypothetical protein
MKKTIIFFVVFLLAIGLGFSQKFSLKINAGIGTVSGGDIADGIKGLSDLLAASFSSSGTFVFPGSGLNFCAEFIYHLNPKIGAGFGIGYFSAGKESQVTYTIEELHVTHTLKPSVGIIPVTASIHFYPPFASKIKLDLAAGLGVYLAHLNHDEAVSVSSRASGTFDYTYASGSKMGFGFHAAVNAEYPLSPKLSLVAGVLARFASVALSTGDWTETDTGIFGDSSASGSDHAAWYYDYTPTVGGSTYPQIVFAKDAPTGSDVANAREAKLSLGGLVFSVGVRIGLGKLSD